MKVYVLRIDHVSPGCRISKVVGVYTTRNNADDVYRLEVARDKRLSPRDFILSEHELDG